MVTLRIRSLVWFATGVALTLLATVLVMQTWRVDAAPGDKDSTFVPTAPCRLFDMRPGEAPSGGKKSPLVAGESSVHVQQVTGSVGNCVAIPAEATAVSMNVTIVSPTAQSNLRVYPADVATPTVSNLNWLPGQSPTPNKVDVKLSDDGKIKLYNHAGTVYVLADVVGYYTNTSLKALQGEIDALAATVANSKPIMRSARVEDVAPDPEGTRKVIATVTINAPVDGTVQLVGSTWEISNTTGTVTCNLTSGAGNTDNVGELADTDRTLDLFEAEKGFCSTNGAIKVTAGTHTLNLVASARAGMDLANTTLDAIFTPGGRN
jgi:hypothetical protein